MMLVNEADAASQANSPLGHASSRALFRYWEGLRADRPAPCRDEIDLKRIAFLVPHLAIIERSPQHGEFVWRLAGSGVCDFLTREVTANPVSAGFDSFETDIIRRFLGVAVERFQPCIFRWQAIPTFGNSMEAELIGLPMIARDGDSRQILAGLFPFEAAAHHGGRQIVALHLRGARSIWTEPVPGLAAPALKPPPRSMARRVLQVIAGGKS